MTAAKDKKSASFPKNIYIQDSQKTFRHIMLSRLYEPLSKWRSPKHLKSVIIHKCAKSVRAFPNDLVHYCRQ